jgi:predicted PurR-regulated permease PerM
MATSANRTVTISTGTIVKTLAILFALWFAWLISDIILLLFTSLLLAGVMYPFVRTASRYKVPKSLAVVVFYILFFGAISVSFALIIPAIVTEAGAFLSAHGTDTAWLKQGVGALQGLSEKYNLADNLQASFGNIQAQASRAVSSFFGTITDVFGGIAGFLLVLVLALYIIVEESAVKTLFKNLIPNEYQEFAGQVMWQVIERLGDWLRGQLVLSLIIGVCYFAAYTIIGVPYALLLALMGGLLEFVPYLGPFISAVPALFLAFSASPGQAFAALVAILIIQQLENNFIVPKVMQKAVGLNPIVSIVAFMVGGKLFGVVGAIFAIPVATAVSVALPEIIRFQREHRSN